MSPTDEEAAVLVEGAIAWSTEAHATPPGPIELRRMAAVYERWALVYGATAGVLRAKADELDRHVIAAMPPEPPAAMSAPPVKVPKPKRPAKQAPTFIGFKLRERKHGPVIHVLPTGEPAPVTAPAPPVITGPRAIPKPPPIRRAVAD